jgi:hypothetical protein
MLQSFKTAITRTKPSKPMKILEDKGLLSDGLGLDYGCGRGFDADHYGLDKFDPHYFNNKPLLSGYDFITCNYVLNVVDESTQADIVEKIKSLLTDDGVAYISVRRDIKQPTVTVKNTYQCPVFLSLPVVYEDSSTCIYVLNKGAI